MKRPFQIVTSLLFIFCLMLTGVLTGLMTGRMFISVSGFGAIGQLLTFALAGGVLGAVAGAIASSLLSHPIKKILTIIFGIYIISVSSWIGWKISQNNVPTISEEPPVPVTKQKPIIKDLVGIGMVKIPVQEENPLYLFASIDDVITGVPEDSLVFKWDGKSHLIAHQPAELSPDALYPSYEICLQRALIIRDSAIGVLKSGRPDQVWWLHHEAVSFLPWDQFWPGVAAVFPRDLEANPIVVSPNDSPDNIIDVHREDILRPVEIKESWMQVDIFNSEFDQTGTGWLKWRNEDELLISYDLNI